MEQFDIAVLGAGSAGLNIAPFLNSIGLKVLLAEKHLVGGDCLNYGCVPSKALLTAARRCHAARSAGLFGITASGSAQMDAVAAFIRERIDIFRQHENPDALRRQGIHAETGAPRFIAPHTIELNGRLIRARRFIIATGSSPVIPALPGLEKVNILTNETIFANDRLPEHMVIIGGGPAGIEIAQAYRRLGAHTTVLEAAARILPREDPDISDILAHHLHTEGIHLKTSVRHIAFPSPNSVTFFSNRPETLHFDALFLATGRTANISGLQPENADIKIKEGKIVLDDYLRTSNRRIYCCGDVSGGPMFTHWAEYQAAIVVNNLISPFKRRVRPERFASVVFTDPEVAAFGLNAAQLSSAQIPFQPLTVSLNEVDRAICDAEGPGLLKIFLNKKRLLGGALIAPHAGEIIGELIGFQTLRIPFSKLYFRTYPYPTLSRITRKAVQKFLARKLSPRTARILNFLCKLQNPR